MVGIWTWVPAEPGKKWFLVIAIGQLVLRSVSGKWVTICLCDYTVGVAETSSDEA